MKAFTQIFGVLSLAALFILTGCGNKSDKKSNVLDTDKMSGATTASAAEKTAVLTTYAKIAYASYDKALNDAQALKTAVDTFAGSASQENLDAAKSAWLASRDSYGLTEAFRLSEGPIDAEGNWVEDAYKALEGQINAWPLDENMIDYTYATGTQGTAAGSGTREGDSAGDNIVNTESGNFTPSGTGAEAVDVTTLNADTITALNENGGEANVATGYHAIEFLLWGQDQDNTGREELAGQRHIEDYEAGNTDVSDTDDFSDRRIAYLQAATDKLVDDLTIVRNAWDATNGEYRKAFLNSSATASHNLTSDEALKQVLAGMGVFLKSELANERLKVAVFNSSQEDEHSCFSDNTHVDIETNYRGFWNIYNGKYDADGDGDYSDTGDVSGTGFKTIVDKYDASTGTDITANHNGIDTKLETMTAKATAASGKLHFDQQIKDANAEYRVSLNGLVNDLREMGDTMVDVASVFDISLTSNDVTDPDETQTN